MTDIRVPKFQAWHKQERKMYRVVTLYLGRKEQGVTLKRDDSSLLTCPMDEVFLREFTELVDRDGIDIYEHDIVIWDGGQYTVIFSDQDGAWILKDDRDDWECPSLYGVRSPQQSRIVIIGNVYEHRADE